MEKKSTEEEDELILEEIHVLLQAKRTALKIIRFGIALFIAQIAAVGYMIADFRHHTFSDGFFSVDALVVVGSIIVGLTIFLMVGPLMRIRRLDRQIVRYKLRYDSMHSFHSAL